MVTLNNEYQYKFLLIQPRSKNFLWGKMRKVKTERLNNVFKQPNYQKHQSIKKLITREL